MGCCVSVLASGVAKPRRMLRPPGDGGPGEARSGGIEKGREPLRRGLCKPLCPQISRELLLGIHKGKRLNYRG